MKANKAQLDSALKAPAATRFFLFYGPDEAGSRALAKRIGAVMGADAERIDIAGTELKADPARLADEAAAISLFGGARYIIVEPAGEESLAAVEALAEAATAGNPVALVAGALRPTSKLLKLALAEKGAIAFASYAPEGRDADRLVAEMAKAEGLDARPDVARRIADGAGGNRALMAQEIAKLALYLDAAPDRPKPLDHDAIDAVGVGSESGDLGRMVDSVMDGDAATLRAEFNRLASEGIEGIPLVRALLRRTSLLARLRAEVEKGQAPGAVMASQGKAIFWKEKDRVAGQLVRWRSDLLAKATSRLVEAERLAKASGSPGSVAVDEELFAICRQAARLR
ncbi:DNA polymerase III subunit delta [Allosphingosinicella indica]|uniref:DNA-directed DNA polymerase n=1 Tax=Allosphingosinicella indica TaxID=941907 RepID=A0A1X7G664_9SPHN|nr:DNA polymerase III subunit delta [Allosphingosinicella indica]SMF63852.1 DNA polymerase III, delta subunit [Allosphingosinicella indica]